MYTNTKMFMPPTPAGFGEQFLKIHTQLLVDTAMVHPALRIKCSFEFKQHYPHNKFPIIFSHTGFTLYISCERESGYSSERKFYICFKYAFSRHIIITCSKYNSFTTLFSIFVTSSQVFLCYCADTKLLLRRN
jgi:hypothetical protein